MNVWDNEKNIETLKTLWADGYSASQIAELLSIGVTRNAVIGKICRLGLSRKGTPGTYRQLRKSKAPKQKRQAKGTAKAQSAAWQGSFGSLKAGTAKFELEPLPSEEIPTRPLVKLDNLEPQHCRWPFGDPKTAGFGFCGCKAFPGMPYCEAHARRAYEQPKLRTRQNARQKEDA